MSQQTITIGSNFHNQSREISIAFRDGVSDLPLSPFCGPECGCDKITWAKHGEEILSIDVHGARVFAPETTTYMAVIDVAASTGHIKKVAGPAFPAPGGWTYQGVCGLHGTLLLESESETECQAALDVWLAEVN